MSFRNTFITDFIYQASDATRELNGPVRTIFEQWSGSGLVHKVDERGYGYYAGTFKTLSGTTGEATQDLDQVVRELEKVTNIPFRLVVLVESGPVLTYEITPSHQ